MQLLFGDEFLLDLGLEGAVDKNAGPFDAVDVDVSAFPAHQVALPLALVGSTISVDHLANAVNDALVPLALVLRTRGEVVSALAVHLVVTPLTLVLFVGVLALSASENDLALAMLELFPFLELPSPLVLRLVDILEFSVTALRNLFDFFSFWSSFGLLCAFGVRLLRVFFASLFHD